MLGETGSVLIGLAMAVATYTAIAAYLSIRRRDSRWQESAQNGAFAAAGLLALALLLLLAAFMADAFGIQYVAAHSSKGMPFYLKISAVWAGQEGSLLLWAFLQALFTAMAIRRPSAEARPLVPWATAILGLTTVFFAGVTLFLSNPFSLSEAIPLDGQGLNPLLRHPGMVFHPPALFLGYVGLAIPFAFAMAALLTRRLDGWTAAVRRWTLAAWLFLGLGLLLGARWAYDVLGWGGYWGWDPVENAALMPWLTSTALLHGIAMQDERRGYRAWNILLAALSFALVLFGTFATRSGMIQSVHAFARSSIGYYFLAFILLVVAVSVALVVRARSALGGGRESDGLLSRNGAFYLTLVLLVTATATVFVGSILPTITEALVGQRFEAGPEWFDAVMGPQLAAIVFLIGVCPLLGRAARALPALRARGWPAVVGALAALGGAVFSGFTGWAPLIGFGIVGLAAGTAIAEITRDAILRARRQNETPVRALWELIGQNRRKYGGYVVHVGVILMALGVIGTRVYELETETVLTSGEQASVGRYTLFFEELRQDLAVDHTSVWASVAVYRDGAYLITLQPQLNLFGGTEQNVTVPALRAGMREDLYLVLAGWSEDGSTATFKVFVNPLASFIWLGGLVFMAGGVVAAWSGPRGTTVVISRGRRHAVGAVLGLVIGLGLLAAAGVAMWGPGHGAVFQAASRPLPGQPAPDFMLARLDGSSLQLSDLRGGIAVVNFWASWCPPCRDEMPDLQRVWEEFEGRDVTVLGVAFQDEEGPVRDMVGEFGVTYPVGLDVDSGIAKSYGVTGPPETFVIDAEGKVARVFIGPVTADALRFELNGLLEGP